MGLKEDKRKAEKKRMNSRKGIGEEMMNDVRVSEKKRKGGKVGGGVVQKRNKKGDDELLGEVVDEAASSKILKLAASQLKEEKEEEEGMGGGSEMKYEIEEDSDEEQFSETEEEYDMQYAYESNTRLSEADERALAMFMSNQPAQRQTLADVLKEKMDMKEDQTEEEVGEQVKRGIKPEVVQVYVSVGKILKTYTCGKLPKAFKILPVLQNWEEIMYITNPHEWSPCAIYQGTKIFSSILNAAMAQRFYSLVLLPKVRDDIGENKRLNYHLYQALKKALYKPAAFYKGIMLPLCEEACTHKEAIIIASVIAKVSIPWTHSAAALMRVAQMNYNGASSIFMKCIINKKYALPYSVVDSVVQHFLTFVDEDRILPVLWHQCLYCFCQRYKTSLTKAQKEQLKPVLRKHNHSQLTPLIRNELYTSLCRDDEKGATPAEMESASLLS